MLRLQNLWPPACLCLTALILIPAGAMGQPAGTANLADLPPKRTFDASAAPEPIPAFQRRLFPLASERKPGNAAPIYLRLAHERTEATRAAIEDNTAKWLAMPIDKMPLTEAGNFVFDERFAYTFRQLNYAAHRQSCEWEYTLEEKNPFSILLPDAQGLRMYVRLLALKARVEIAERKFEDAARTIETGFGMSRHLAEGPFFINSLVAIASARLMTERVEEWIAQPNSPNLYWALTALPRPLIDQRKGLETEYIMVDLASPNLKRVIDRSLWRSNNTARSSLQLDMLHMDLLHRFQQLDDMLSGRDPAQHRPIDVQAVIARERAVARDYLAKRGGYTPAEVKSMTDGQAVTMSLALRYLDIRDETFKTAYLPYHEDQTLQREAVGQHKPEVPNDIIPVAKLFPSFVTGRLAAARLDQQVAALRVVEAIRLHAAAHNGKPPGSLDEIEAVPIPVDPLTGKPFYYTLDRRTARLRYPVVAAEQAIRYEITIRD